MHVLCGTNRPGSNTKRVSLRVLELLSNVCQAQQSSAPKLIDLGQLQADIFNPSSYAEKPAWFLDEFQEPILSAKGLIIVTPEYNGSFPGVLKYFIDMLRFPESLVGLPVALIGCAAGQFGALRSVEQLELILHYRKTHIFGERLFIPGVHEALSDDGKLGDQEPRLHSLVENFHHFASKLKDS